ncbi:MAG: chloride channel protein [Flavobacterium sp.]
MPIQNTLRKILLWITLVLIVGTLAGLASGLFLYSLEEAILFREEFPIIIALLPIGGLLIGYMYYRWGGVAVKGNNLIIEEYGKPKKKIPFRMAPMVLVGTLITHLFGGSAGREGTAVQMGATLADQCTSWFKISPQQRKTLLMMGMSAGFSSLFGTPWAAFLFSFEILLHKKVHFKSIIPVVLASWTAYFVVELLPVHHTMYSIASIPAINFQNIGYALLSGIPFGLAAALFTFLTHFFGHNFKRFIKFPPLRPFLGGIVIALAVFFMGNTDYIGLGIPIILDSFTGQVLISMFLIKIIFTSFTLGAGFKGGEVTPLFFIGATLGSALSAWIPLPIGLMAGMGFVAVFAGATHAPITCAVMGMELFGVEGSIFLALACFSAYIFSGLSGIYSEQIVTGPKRKFYTIVHKKIMHYF